MSSDSPIAPSGGFIGDAINAPVHLINHPFGSDSTTNAYRALSANLYGGENLIPSGGKNDPQAPPPPPTLGQTNLIGLQGQLSHEQRQAAASTILTGGGGLTDEPTTASQVLLGS